MKGNIYLTNICKILSNPPSNYSNRYKLQPYMYTVTTQQNKYTALLDLGTCHDRSKTTLLYDIVKIIESEC